MPKLPDKCPWCGDALYEERDHDHGVSVRRRFGCGSYVDTPGDDRYREECDSYQTDACKILMLTRRIIALKSQLVEARPAGCEVDPFPPLAPGEKETIVYLREISEAVKGRGDENRR